MKCEYCDNEITHGVTRCPSCGAPVPQEIFRQEEQRSVRSDVLMDRHETSPVESPSNIFSCDPYLYVEKKNRIVYIVLAIFLGELGVHNFYAGYVGRGIAQLLISILSFGLLFWISWIWAIIEVCVTSHDGRGIPFE